VCEFPFFVKIKGFNELPRRKAVGYQEFRIQNTGARITTDFMRAFFFSSVFCFFFCLPSVCCLHDLSLSYDFDINVSGLKITGLK